MKEITKIEVRNGKITAYYKKDIEGFVPIPESFKETSPNIYSKRFDCYRYTWHGFGLAIKDNKLYEIDLREDKIKREIEREEFNDQIYCLFVSEYEYAGIPNGLKVQLSKQTIKEE